MLRALSTGVLWGTLVSQAFWAPSRSPNTGGLQTHPGHTPDPTGALVSQEFLVHSRPFNTGGTLVNQVFWYSGPLAQGNSCKSSILGPEQGRPLNRAGQAPQHRGNTCKSSALAQTTSLRLERFWSGSGRDSYYKFGSPWDLQWR